MYRVAPDLLSKAEWQDKKTPVAQWVEWHESPENQWKRVECNEMFHYNESFSYDEAFDLRVSKKTRVR